MDLSLLLLKGKEAASMTSYSIKTYWTTVGRFSSKVYVSTCHVIFPYMHLQVDTSLNIQGGPLGTQTTINGFFLRVKS